MKILGIETSCDETAVSVIEVTAGNNIQVLSNVISSQVKLHAKYGGVVPSLAAREHVKNIRHVFNLALKGANLHRSALGKLDDIDLIAVTRGPGLGPALLVGLTFAKTISWLYKKPIVGVSHLEGHIYSNWLQPVGEFPISNFQFPKNIFPVLNLIVSGGHTELVLMKNHGQYKIIGETMDDAVGEAFDKVARLLDLGYPGGPAISKIAKNGNTDKYILPRPMAKSKNYNLSYSGLKTAVLYLIRDLNTSTDGDKLDKQTKADIAASFQKAAIDVLIQKTMHAAKEYEVKSIMLSGGVSANTLLRPGLNRAAQEVGVKYFQPSMEYTTDNAAMIAMAGYYINGKLKVKKGELKTDYKSVKMDANLRF